MVFPVACYGVTNEIPPLKKGVRGILKFMFPLNTLQLAAFVIPAKLVPACFKRGAGIQFSCLDSRLHGNDD